MQLDIDLLRSIEIDLRSSDIRDQNRGIKRLLAASPSSAIAARLILRRAQQGHIRERLVLLGGSLVILLLILDRSILRTGWITGLMALLIGLLALGWDALLAPVLLGRMRQSQVGECLAGALSRTDETAALGLLLELGPVVPPSTGWTSALERLIPRLTPADFIQLTVPQRTELYRLLEVGSFTLRLAILEAIERTGDLTSLPHVQQWLGSFPTTVGPPEIRVAGERCAGTLERLAEQEKASKTLLRAAEGPGDSGTLLRPASGAGEAEENVLLRPVDDA